MDSVREALLRSIDDSEQALADSDAVIEDALHNERSAQERQRAAECRSEELEEALAAVTAERQAHVEELAEAEERQRQSEELAVRLEAQAQEGLLEAAQARDGLERAEEASRQAEHNAAQSAEEEAAEARARAQAEVARDLALAAEADARRQAAESREQEEAMVGRDMLLEVAELQRHGEEAERRAGESAARCEEETLAAQRAAVANDVLREQAVDRDSKLEVALEGRSELRTEAVDLQEEIRAAEALCARAEEAAAAAGAAEAEEVAAATEALALKAEALQGARAATEEAAQDRQDRLAASEAAEDAEERLRAAREAAERRAQEAEGSEEALQRALEERSRLQAALSDAEANTEGAEGTLRAAEQEFLRAEDEASARASELSAQRELYLEAEGRRVQWEELAEEAERRAAESELGKRVKEWQELSDKFAAEAAANRESADYWRDEAIENHESAARAKAEFDRERSKNAAWKRRANKAVQILSPAYDEDSVLADAHSVYSLSSDQSWDLVSRAGEGDEHITTHSLPADALVLNCNGKEIPVRDLKPRTLLKSVNAQRDDGLAADDAEVCVRAVHGTQDPTQLSFVRCAVQEGPSTALGSRGSAIDLLPEQLVLAKRSGASAWHPTQAWELQDDFFSLLEWDETERDSLVATPLQEATKVQPPMRNIIKFDVEGPEGVVFASTGGGPYIALCGSSRLDDEVVVLEFMRSPKEYHRALENSPSLLACRTAIQAQNKPTEGEGGAKIFVPPSLVEPVLEAIDKDNFKLRGCHVIVTRRFQPLVEAAIRTLRSNDRVKLRREKPVFYTPHAADYDATAVAGPRADPTAEDARLPRGGGSVLVVWNTFLHVVSEAPSESGSQSLTTASTTDAHLGPGANHRRRVERMT